MSDDPFAALGLRAQAGLSDEDVRAAWRRVAAATHPDRDDGGDPGRFSAAAAAYNTLRTSFGRGEALADLGLAVAAPEAATRAATRAAARAAARAARWTAPWVGHRGARRAGRPGARHARPGAAQAETQAAMRAGAPGLGLGLGGRGWRLALLGAGAALVPGVALLASGWTPATIGLLAGALTWVAVAGRAELRGRGDG